jgi:hypothetical protein
MELSLTHFDESQAEKQHKKSVAFSANPKLLETLQSEDANGPPTIWRLIAPEFGILTLGRVIRDVFRGENLNFSTEEAETIMSTSDDRIKPDSDFPTTGTVTKPP